MAKKLKALFCLKKRGEIAFYLAVLSFFLCLYLCFKDVNFTFPIGSLTFQDWTAVLQTLVIFITAVIAVCSMHSSRKTSKERATLDVILGDYQDKKLVEASNLIFNLVRDNRDQLIKVFQNENNQHTEDRNSLIVVLNRYEFYASAINHGILDEHLFKRSHCSNFIKLWNAVSPVVMKIRDTERKETIFKDFEILVFRWKSNPLTVDDL